VLRVHRFWAASDGSDSYDHPMMDSDGEYRVDIERRASGSPKFHVSVTLGRKPVGDDYAISVQQAEQLAKRMIQRHQELTRQLRDF